MIKAIVIIVGFIAFLTVLILMAKRNERLEGQVKELEDTNKKQVQVTKVYEEKQKVANEIITRENRKDTCDNGINTGNNIVSGFNDRVSNKGKK